MRSIVIADSHTLCREALCAYIRHAEPEFLVREASDLQGLQVCMKTGPDIVLVEKNLIEDGFIQAITAKIGLIVSDICEAEAIDLQVMGIFPKTLSCKEFIEGIDEMLAERKFFPRTGKVIITENVMAFKRPKTDFNLTQREKEVLGHLIKGESNKEIGRALDLQVVTIKLHVRGICRKMKAQNRTQAALIAIENGWG